MAPLAALAAFAEGMCPVHLVPLETGEIRLGGQGGVPVSWRRAGWCETCQAWWHWSEAEDDGCKLFTATWTTGDGGKAEAAGWTGRG